MVLLRTSARPPTHENNHRKVRNPGREGSGPAVKEIDFIKIDVEGHELQGGPVSAKIAASADLRRRIFKGE